MQPVLYILMRNDLDSLNPGKAVAQGSHATSLFESRIRIMCENDSHFQDLLRAWDEDDIGFGVTLVLGVKSEFDLVSRCVKASSNPKVISEEMLDPTYPIRDGGVVHRVPFTSCGYIFGDKKDIAPYIEDLELY